MKAARRWKLPSAMHDAFKKKNEMKKENISLLSDYLVLIVPFAVMSN